MFSCGNQKTTTQKVENTDVKTVDPTTYASTITSGELKEMLYTYASDEFEGRDTGEKGQKMAVEYLKEKYVSMEIPSALPNNDYFQEVPLQKEKSPNITLSVGGKNFEAFTDFVSYGSSDTQELSASEIVYVGHGIDTETYSDYANVDVKGKIVLVKEGEPKNTDGMFMVSGTSEASKWSNGRQGLSSKRDAAKDHGAKAFFIVDAELFERYGPYYKKMKDADKFGRLSLVKTDIEMPQFIISASLAKAMFPDVNEVTKPQSVQTDLKVSIQSIKAEVNSENVAAFIKGSEFSDEIVVISAHLDHIGIEDGEIFNGADDDGSGTIAIIEIAQAFKKAVDDGYRPRRSILFLHVTGEEKGLLGSEYYTDMDPIFPLANTMVNLNIDMIGRVDDAHTSNRNYLYLIGADRLSSELHTISEDVNKKYMNMTFDYTYNDENDPNRYYYRSDHYNFAKNNIPVIFYFNGTHADYHKSTDTVEKIEYDLLESRSRLIFHTAWELANRDDKIIVDKISK